MLAYKFQLKSIIAIIVCFLGLTIISSCSKDSFEGSLEGKWVTTDYQPIHNDTIHFTSDGRVENYFRFPHHTLYPASSYYFTYSITEGEINITWHQPDNADYTETFEYMISDDILVINKFSNPFSVTLEARWPVTFKRIE